MVGLNMDQDASEASSTSDSLDKPSFNLAPSHSLGTAPPNTLRQHLGFGAKINGALSPHTVNKAPFKLAPSPNLRFGDHQACHYLT